MGAVPVCARPIIEGQKKSEACDGQNLHHTAVTVHTVSRLVFLKTYRWVVFQYFIMVLLIFTLEITAGALGFLHKDEVGHRNLWVFQT